MRKKIIAILTVIAFGLAIGGTIWTSYSNAKLEAAAYQYTSEALYTPVKDLVVDDVVKIDKGTYDISYHYVDPDGKSHRGQQLGVAL